MAKDLPDFRQSGYACLHHQIIYRSVGAFDVILRAQAGQSQYAKRSTLHKMIKSLPGEAGELGLPTSVEAPQLGRGGSLSGDLNTLELFQEGLWDALVAC